MAKKTKKKKNAKKNNKTLNSIEMRLIAILGIFLLSVGLFKLGFVGEVIFRSLLFLFGNMHYLAFALLFIFFIYLFVKAKIVKLSSPEAVGFILVLLSTSIMSCYSVKNSGFSVIGKYMTLKIGRGGGFIGYFLYAILSSLFSYTGALLAAILLLIIGVIFIFGRVIVKYKEYENDKYEEDIDEIPSLKKLKAPHFFDRLDKKKKEDDILFPDTAFDEPKKEKPLVIKEEKKKEKKKEEKPIKLVESKPVKIKNGTYQLPSYKLLNPVKEVGSNSDEVRNARIVGNRLEDLLKQFGVNVHVEDLMIGPTVTKYELKLEIGTRVNKILSLQDDIQLALAAKDIRIEAPIPGKPFVGIEVPNKVAAMVPYNEIFQLSMNSKSWNNKLAVPLGKDVSGDLIVAELDKMPHLLVAGATGSGKSVCVNSIITSILMKATPDEVKLILVDPKKVELSNYNGIPHLLSPVVTDPKKAAGVLQEVVSEMERRYEVFAANNKRNMGSYNTFAKEYNESHDDEKEVMPYIVVILDEVADLMMVASKTVEDCIMRISQMARAAGIHMIVATQRPSTDIITGVIKANIPSRIAFAVSSSIDSRTILDTSGAEKLLGKGDMLFSPMGSSSPIRVQGAFVDDKEVATVVEFVSNQMEADYDEKYINAKEASNEKGKASMNSSEESEDEEYEEARAFVIQAQKASTSLLQRKFRIGYNKAARIIEQLEENGVIGPQVGSRPREVYIKSFDEDDQF